MMNGRAQELMSGALPSGRKSPLGQPHLAVATAWATPSAAMTAVAALAPPISGACQQAGIRRPMV